MWRQFGAVGLPVSTTHLQLTIFLKDFLQISLKADQDYFDVGNKS